MYVRRHETKKISAYQEKEGIGLVVQLWDQIGRWRYENMPYACIYWIIKLYRIHYAMVVTLTERFEAPRHGRGLGVRRVPPRANIIFFRVGNTRSPSLVFRLSLTHYWQPSTK